MSAAAEAPVTPYDAAVSHLNSLVPELHSAQAPAGSAPGTPRVRRKFSLDQIRILAAALGNPHRQFPSVLIAGTNGKGSTAATLASIAQATGLRTGLYTSPHLARVNERIRLLSPHLGAPHLASEMWDRDASATPGAPSIGQLHRPMDGSDESQIPDSTFARLYFRVHDTAQQLVLDGELPNLPSYFELLTALAFLYFAEPEPGAPPVDLAILEVGMGGRLDATNLVDPLISVITDISLDHQEWLGSTIAEIAREKAGILRPHGTLITLPQHPQANQAIGEVATELDVRAIPATDYMPLLHASPTDPYPIQVLGSEILIDSPLKGTHQHRNIALAIAAAVELAETHHFPITASSIAQGIHQTHWPGRLEHLALPGLPEVLLDVAHNPAGAWTLRSALSSLGTPKPVMIPSKNLLSDTRDSASEAAIGSCVPGHDFSRADQPKNEIGALAPEASPGAPSTSQPQRDLGELEPTQVLVFSCLRDKPLREMAQILFPLFDHVILAPIQSPRATDLADLLAAAESTGTPATQASTVAEALELALNLRPARVVVSGSVYLVGEARTLLLNRTLEPATK
jgi:dihydrofolate synthase/folylpolyglutamate synthase